mmetsp:Transcript_33884/g.41556  ORF Transcript_33884/g.41556 Transcript_33884/m.41556 type:complete len:283 (+) Transcript_33884:201-1049(+)
MTILIEQKNMQRVAISIAIIASLAKSSHPLTFKSSSRCKLTSLLKIMRRDSRESLSKDEESTELRLSQIPMDGFAGINNSNNMNKRLNSQTAGLFLRTDIPKGGGSSGRLQSRLSRLSNAASLLCVLDCTILPIITIILPFFGVLNTSLSQSAFLHELGHRAALYFVLPVGSMAAAMNYASHQRPRKLFPVKMLSLAAVMGLLLIYAANAGHHAPIVSMLPHDLAHKLHCGGVVHRVVNIVGCGLLLGSNFWSHRLSGGDGACCVAHETREEEETDGVFFSW